MWTWNPARYGPTLAGLLTSAPLPELGPGLADRSLTSQLQSLTAADMFPDERVADAALADCCRAGLWLAFDFLEESHTISQGIATVEGSYWHGLMHRREPDYENAKYWYRRVGRHPVFSPLLAGVRGLITAELDTVLRRVIGNASWDPFAFIDQCRAVYQRATDGEIWCRQVAQLEWQLLFDYCYTGAMGREPSWSERS